MKKMSELELIAILNQAEQDAVDYSEELGVENEKVYDAYLQKPYGDEVEDQSQVVSPDIQDIVESDMPGLARIFLGTNQPVVFEPNTSSPQEAQEVEQKNQYVHQTIQNAPGAFHTLFGWMKTAEIETHSVIKYFIEEQERVDVNSFEGVSEMEVAEIIMSYEGEDFDVMDEEQNEDGTFNFKVKTKIKDKKFQICKVPNDLFLVTKGRTTLDDCELVGDTITDKTRGDLIAEGYPRALVEDLPTATEAERLYTRNKIRDDRIDDDEVVLDWASQRVELSDLYVKVDFDGDGIAERRHVLKSGNTILLNEPFDHVPYALLSAIPVPDELIGRSRAQMAYSTQRVKTVVKRQMLDNMYMVNHPRNVVHPDVNIDDMLNVRPNGIVRMRKDSVVQPGQAVFPMVTPYMGDKSMQVLQYEDHSMGKSLGVQAASQGLNSDDLNSETATRYNGIRDEGRAKVELVARNFAETGWRKLYEGAAWMLSRFQDTEAEISILGQPLKINPTKWRYDHCVSTKVGTGASEADRTVQEMQLIYQLQSALQQTGSPMVDQVKFYNTLKEMTLSMGYKNVDEFFNNPEVPQELLQAQVEIMQRKLQEATMMLEQSQNPLAEAEQIKQQAFLLKAQSDAELKAAELTEKVRQFNEKMEADAEKQDKDLALKLTELEQKVGEQLDSQVADNVLTFNPETGNFEGQV